MLSHKNVVLIGTRLRQFGFSTLREYYQSDAWQAVKARMKASRLEKNCLCCGSRDHLQLHHKSYKSLCKEKLRHLCFLCDTCHNFVHKVSEEKGLPIWAATKYVQKEMAHLLHPKPVSFQTPSRKKQKASHGVVKPLESGGRKGISLLGVTVVPRQRFMR